MDEKRPPDAFEVWDYFEPKKCYPTQGHTHLHRARSSMLAAYDAARETARTKCVQTEHGVMGEAVFRRWLRSFLPLRFGVCPGYIVSQGRSEKEKLRHYDVIIYNRLDAPVLWEDPNPDSSDQGRGRVLPAEHVRAVIEVKATLTKRHAQDAMAKLEELRPLLHLDEEFERYPVNLPRDFFSMAVFFEASEADVRAGAPELLPDTELRGYAPGIVLRASDRVDPRSLRVIFARELTDDELCLPRLDELEDLPAVRGGRIYVKAALASDAFSQFAFDVLARLNGTHDPELIPTFHAGPASSDEME